MRRATFLACLLGLTTIAAATEPPPGPPEPAAAVALTDGEGLPAPLGAGGASSEGRPSPEEEEALRIERERARRETEARRRRDREARAALASQSMAPALDGPSPKSTGAITGTITDATTGLPLSGIDVYVYVAGSSGPVGWGQTNASGVYVAASLPAGTYYLSTANASGYQNELYDDIPCLGGCSITSGTPVQVTSGTTTTLIDFALERGGRISGAVTDAVGAPLAGIRVNIYDSSETWVASGQTDGTGAYAITSGLPAGTYYAVTYNDDGYRNELYDNVLCLGWCSFAAGAPIAVTVGATTSGIDFALGAGGRIAGRVTDEATSAPLVDTGVDVYSSSGSWVAAGYTDTSGEYITDAGLPAGTYYARTYNYSGGYIDELYDGRPCPGWCSVTSGDPIVVTGTATTAGIDFALAEGGRISGRVTDAITGDPLVDIEVDVYDASGSNVGYGFTNGSGNYVLGTGLPAGTYYARTYNSYGYLNELYDEMPCIGWCSVTSGTPITVTAGATTGGIDFTLMEGGRISGTVTALGTHAPLANVSVRIYSAAGSSMGYGYTNGLGQYTSDAGLPGGTYYAATSNSIGYVDEIYDNILCAGGCSVTSGTPISVAAGATSAGIDFALEPGGRLSGTVTAAGTGAPLARTYVNVYDSYGSYVGYGRTDDAGYYVTTAFPPGTHHALTSNSLGYLDELYDDIECHNWSCAVTSGTPIATTGGAISTAIDFALTVGGSISGRVTDSSTGDPLPGVGISVYDSSGSYVAGRVTDASGHYTTTSTLPSGNYYARTGNALGYVEELYDDLPCAGSCTPTTGTAIPVTAGATTPAIDFALDQGGRISGTVTDVTTGLPLEGIAVQVFDDSTTYWGYVRTDGSGHYAFSTGLPGGTYYAVTDNTLGYLDVLYDGISCANGCAVTSGTPITVTAGATTSGIDFALGRGSRISGRVTDAGTGGALASVNVRIYDALGSYAGSVYTDGSGHYLTSIGLVAGAYYARTYNSMGYIDELFDDIACPGSCVATSGTPIVLAPHMTRTGVDFALAEGGRISGTVTDVDGGGPLAGVSVQVYDSSGSYAGSGYTDSAGRYTTGAGLPTGTYHTKTSNWDGYVNELYDDLPCPGSCTVTAGTPIPVTTGSTTSGVDFALEVGGRISGRVTDATTGDPLAYLSIQIYDRLGAFAGSGSTDSSGNYVTGGGLPAGTYHARTYNWEGYVDELYMGVPCPNGQCTIQGGTPITVTKGATTPGVDFALAEGGLIGGVVTDAGTGDPLADVNLRVFSSAGAYVGWGRTDGSGHYLTGAGLPEGSYYVQTSNGDGYLDELYSEVVCPYYGCALEDGTPVAVVPGGTASIDFALSPGGRISGTVTDAATAAPIESVNVEVYDATGTYLAYGKTDSSGAYTLEGGLPTGTYYAKTINFTGYVDELYDDDACAGYGCSVGNGTPISVTTGVTTAGVDFALAPGGLLHGQITEAGSGVPLGQVRVHLLNAAGDQLASAFTSSDGVYRMGLGLPTGSYYLLTTNSGGYLDELYADVVCPTGFRLVDGFGMFGRRVPVPSCALASGTAVPLTVGVDTEVNFALTEGGRVSGVISGSAESLPGVSVEVFDASGQWLGADETDVNGYYLTPAQPGASYYLRTLNYGGWTDELYDDIACSGCDPTTGTAVPVSVGGVSGGVDFDLTLAPLSSLSIDSVAVDEGQTGTSDATFTVTLSPPTGLTVTVEYATSDGTAAAGVDYTGVAGVLTFAPHQTIRTVTVPIHGDIDVEPDETFLVTLSAPTNAVIGTGQGTGTIRNDDIASDFPLTVVRAGIGAGTVTSSPAGIACGMDCTELYLSGTLVTLTAVEGPGSVLVGWSGDCAGVGLTCDVTMDAAKAVTVEFDLVPEGISWERLIGTEAVGSLLRRPSGAGWNAGAVSSRVLVAGSGYVEYTVPVSPGYVMFGLSRGDTDGSYADIDYALYTYPVTGQLYVYEKGVYRGRLGPYAPGDRLRVSVEGGVVTYRQNGVLLGTSTEPPSYPLLLDTSLYSTGAEILDALIAGQLADRVQMPDTGVFWRKLLQTTASGPTLTRQGTTGWNGGASSAQELVSGDGYAEFQVTSASDYMMFGLSHGDSDGGYGDIDFALYTYPVTGQLYVYEKGVYQGHLGPYAPGDRLRVSVEGGVVTYSQNGVLLSISSATPVYPLVTDTSLYSANAVVTDARMGGELREIVGWTHLMGVEVVDDTLTRPGTGGWTAGAISSRRIPAGSGGAEYTVADPTSASMFGLSHGDTDGTYADIDFALYADPSTGQMQVFENGVPRGSFGAYAVGDVLRVSVEDGVVSYLKNGGLLYTSLASATYPLLLDVSVSAGAIQGARLFGNVASPPVIEEAVVWTNAVNATDTAGTLTRPSGYGWNAGAVSTQILRGEGYAEYTVTSTGDYVMFGLSHGDTDGSYADIDYALYTYPVTGQLYVYEKGVYQGHLGPYAPGDRLRVSVEGGVVKYQRNGTLLRFSATLPTFPLNVDCSLYSTGATISGATIGWEE